MTTFDLKKADYSISGITGYSLSQALQHWKSKFETVKHFKRDVINHPGLASLADFVEDIWEEIKPLTVEEALREPNIERRRVMFECIGVAKLFQGLDPELLDRQTVTKTRTRWNDDNSPYEIVYEDTYELYRIEGEKLFKDFDKFGEPAPVFAVRCWCTTTAREFWIYVPSRVAVGSKWDKLSPDAISAIAWTIRIDVSHPKRIFRQGDIIVVEESPDSETVPFYHLNKEQYLSLIISET